MHLLVETALSDGQDLDVLSFEEVDEMKKEYTILNTRIEALKRKLALESKVKDAAQSLARLGKKGGADGSPGKQRRSLLGGRRTGSESLDKTDEEVMASIRKCEDLAQELWRLERRAADIQRRLLQHTAGILQMTHRGIMKDHDSVQINGQARGVSLELGGGHYPYSTVGGILDESHGDFDHQSFYRSIDPLDVMGGGAVSRGIDDETINAVMEAESKLEALNSRLRETIIQINPQLANTYQRPPQVQTNGAPPRPGASIEAQLSYLEQTLSIVDRQRSSITRDARKVEMATEERIEALNKQLRDVINLASPAQALGHPGPPKVSGQSLEGQVTYLEDGLDMVEQHIQNTAKFGDQQAQLDQIQKVLQGLWQIIMTGEEDVRQRKRERRRAMAKNPGGDESDVSPDEGSPNESYSLQAFSTKVQRLHTRASGLKEQKNILRRQIKQQRKLNEKSDETKDQEMSDMTQQLEDTHQALDQSDREAMNTRQELTLVMQRLDAARREWAQKEKQRENEGSQTSRDLQQSRDDLGTLQSQQSSKIKALEKELATTQQAQELGATNLRDQLKGKEHQIGEIESELVRLQTEVTVVRAELDGAYGTRAQRAAEVANSPSNTELQARVQKLQQELTEMIVEYETMTKQSIEFEKEREALERALDGLRDRCEHLETQLSDEKVRWFGVTSPGFGGSSERAVPPPQTTSTTVLKNEFKKMMRDTRAENARMLRVSTPNGYHDEHQIRIVADLTLYLRRSRMNGEDWRFFCVICGRNRRQGRAA